MDKDIEFLREFKEEIIQAMELLKLLKEETNEKEKLYTVEIPNPNHYCDNTFLTKIDGDVFIDMSYSVNWKDDKRNHLTESEIKKNFEWAWKFAKPLEETNE